MPDADSTSDATTDDLGGDIGERAAVLDQERTAVERLELPPSAKRLIVGLVVAYVVVLALLLYGLDGTATGMAVLPTVVALSFVLESTDSATGMGFGTGLSPLLFALGYEPLQVVPALLLSEAATGIVSGAVHHEVRNVTISLRPLNREARLVIGLAAVSAGALAVAAALVYATVSLPEGIVETYASLLVVVMGLVGVVSTRLDAPRIYRPRRLLPFAALAGASKGVGGGGFGPVVTLGQIVAGVYEKSAVAITSLAEGLVSAFGGVAFLVLWYLGTPIDLTLLPSVFTRGVLRRTRRTLRRSRRPEPRVAIPHSRVRDHDRGRGAHVRRRRLRIERASLSYTGSSSRRWPVAADS